MLNKFFNKAVVIASLLHLNSACSTNTFSAADEPDPGEAAVVAMEDGKPQKAIELLEKKLRNDTDNYRLISILSAAYAQKHGVDTLSFAEKLATGTALDGSANAITAMYSILPEATDDNIDGIHHANQLLVGIPVDSRTEADNFKLALLSMAETSLRTKKYDINGDGILSPEELLAMNGSDATAILSALLNSEAALAVANANGVNSEQAAEAISQIQDAIASSPGANDEEKLKNYLASQGYNG